MTIQDKAQEYYDMFETIKISDDETRIVLKSDKFDKGHKLTSKVDDSTSLSMDSVYNFTYEALGMISDTSEGDNMEELYMEADIYTSNLTEWLNESNYHVEYLTDSLSEYGSQTNGFELLQNAQGMAKQEVLRTVIEFLEEESA